MGVIMMKIKWSNVDGYVYCQKDDQRCDDCEIKGL